MTIIKNHIISFFLVFLLSCGNEKEVVQEEGVWFNGVDLSFQPEIEMVGFEYKDQEGNTIELLPFYQANEFNLVRLRIWHTPAQEYASLASIIAYAVRAQSNGFQILLSLHYSDTWADPGKQFLPNAWAGLSYDELKQEVYDYTRFVLNEMASAGIQPAMIQVGNETNSGFLWDFGRVGGSFDTNWDQYLDLSQEAIKAVRETAPTTRIMLHYAGIDGASYYYQQASSLDYDVMGLSYYSIWHGNRLSRLQSQLTSLVDRFDKDLMVVETAYPWTLNWLDMSNNLWGLSEQLISGYPATPEGQRDFLTDLGQLVRDLPNNRGIGVCYWAPDWVAYQGTQGSASSWENAAMFDFEGKALPSTKAAVPDN